jgi:hypothetical protein
MENTDPYLSDENVNTVQRRAPAKDRTGKNTVMAARGGVDGDAVLQHSEQTPLLDSSGDEESTDGDASRPTWEFEDEWEGLPWHKRPSVGSSLALKRWRFN